MKKNLLRTTALVGAGLLVGAGVGQGANAAEPFSLTTSGSFSVALQAQDEDDGVGEPAQFIQDIVFATDGEIRFTGRTELDNGLQISARVEYEAHNQSGGAAVVDERWLRFQGGFGQLTIGHNDNAAYEMHYVAPVGAYQFGVNTPTFGLPQVGGNAITSYSNTFPGLGSDGNKVIYFTPRIQGFQLGLSYQPDGSRTASDTPGISPALTGGQEDIFSIGANYVSTVNGVDVAISGGYVSGDLEGSPTPVATADDNEQWVAGINVGYAGFTVGGSFRQDDKGLSGDFDEDIWDIGVTYSTGPWTGGFTYLRGEAEQGAGINEDELDAWAITGTYNMGPGVNLWGGVKMYDFEDSVGAIGSQNEAFFGGLGASVSF